MICTCSPGYNVVCHGDSSSVCALLYNVLCQWDVVVASVFVYFLL